jgi:hypothetical protein
MEPMTQYDIMLASVRAFSEMFLKATTFFVIHQIGNL